MYDGVKGVRWNLQTQGLTDGLDQLNTLYPITVFPGRVTSVFLLQSPYVLLEGILVRDIQIARVGSPRREGLFGGGRGTRSPLCRR